MKIKKQIFRILNRSEEKEFKYFIHARLEKQYDSIFESIKSDLVRNIEYSIRRELVNEFLKDNVRVSEIMNNIYKSISPEKIIEEEIKNKIKKFVLSIGNQIVDPEYNNLERLEFK